jgi:SAM-dependent methyltransferase
MDPTEAPEIVADVGQLPLADVCTNAVICTEVLEHVAQPDSVIRESYRILRPGGIFIGSMPFLYRVHADPFDFQRYTAAKFEHMLVQAGFTELVVQPQGFYFTVLAEMLRDGLNQLKPRLVRWPIALFVVPVLWLLLWFEQCPGVQEHPRFSSYTTGYFVKAYRRQDEAFLGKD